MLTQSPIARWPALAATTVGSFHRPSWLAERGRAEVSFRFSGPELTEAQDDATIVVLHEQERAGLDVLTDGEQRRSNFIYHLLGTWAGVDLVDRRPKAIRGRNTERLVPRITGPVRRRSSAMANDLLFAKAHTELPLKMAVPGPMTVVDTTCDESYGDEEALAMDVAAALNAELLELEAAGCNVVQIDEPAMTRLPDKVARYGLRALARCVQGLRIPTLVHLCYGYPGAGALQHEHGYAELLAMLSDVPVSGYSLEFARSGFDAAVLRACGQRLVMFGCVDPSDTPPEALDVVVGRIRAGLEYVEPHRMLVAPDCGLMTVSRELGRQKVALLVRAAREVRQGL